MRWEEPHHPGPGLQLERHNNPLSPTLQHDLPLQAHLHPAQRGRFGRERSRPSQRPPPSSAAAAVPDDADDLRGFHFRQLLRRTLTWS